MTMWKSLTGTFTIVVVVYTGAILLHRILLTNKKAISLTTLEPAAAAVNRVEKVEINYLSIILLSPQIVVMVLLYSHMTGKEVLAFMWRTTTFLITTNRLKNFSLSLPFYSSVQFRIVVARPNNDDDNTPSDATDKY